MSINYPLLDKSLKKSKIKSKPKTINTRSSSYHPKNINLDEIYEGLLFSNTNKFHKKFSGRTIMNEALNIGKKITTEISEKDDNKINKTLNYKYVDEIIENAHFAARNNYVEKLSENFKINLRNNFKNILMKSTSEDVDLLEQKIQQIEELKIKYEKALVENSKLQHDLTNINDEFRQISKDLHIKTQLINKEQLKNISIKTIQPIFEELIKEFPEEDPKDIVTDLKINKEKYLSQIHELNKFKFKINDLEKERKNDDNKHKAFQNNINDKIHQEKLLTNSIANQLDKDYNVYKEEYDFLLNYKKENENLKQLLYNIYSWIKEYIPKKSYENYVQKIGKDPLNNIKTFDARIFNSSEFVSLVNECILSKVTTCYDGVLLRATIAFGNYLARKHLKPYNKYRYDPIGTFRDMKSVIDAKEFENYQLIGVIKDLNHKKATSLLKIKELIHQLKKGKIKFQIMENKFQKFIDNNKNAKYEKELYIPSKTNTNIDSSFSINTQNNKKSENNKEDKIKNIVEEKDKLRKKFFITNDGQKGKKKKNMKNKIQSASTNKRFLTENNKINDSFYENKNDEDNDNDLYKETMLSIKNRTLNNNKLKSLQKKLCDLEFSKNRDKLIKTNGFNGKENLLINIKDIMKEVYIENPKTFSVNKNNKLYLTKTKEFNFATEKKKKRPKTTTLPKVDYGQDYEFISAKIMNDIDTIISKTNDIDLHDFTTDQNYKDKRNLGLVNKKPEEKIVKKNSLDSLLKEESGQTSEEEEEENSEEEDEKD